MCTVANSQCRTCPREHINCLLTIIARLESIRGWTLELSSLHARTHRYIRNGVWYEDQLEEVKHTTDRPMQRQSKLCLWSTDVRVYRIMQRLLAPRSHSPAFCTGPSSSPRTPRIRNSRHVGASDLCSRRPRAIWVHTMHEDDKYVLGNRDAPKVRQSFDSAEYRPFLLPFCSINT